MFLFFERKFLVLGKMPKIFPKTGFFDFYQKINPFMFLFFTQKWFLKEFFVILQKYVWGKNLALKCFQPTRLQHFLIINISEKSSFILIIFHGVGLQAKAASEKSSRLVECYQVCLSCNQIV